MHTAKDRRDDGPYAQSTDEDGEAGGRWQLEDPLHHHTNSYHIPPGWWACQSNAMQVWTIINYPTYYINISLQELFSLSDGGLRQLSLLSGQEEVWGAWKDEQAL